MKILVDRVVIRALSAVFAVKLTQLMCQNRDDTSRPVRNTSDLKQNRDFKHYALLPVITEQNGHQLWSLAGDVAVVK